MQILPLKNFLMQMAPLPANEWEEFAPCVEVLQLGEKDFFLHRGNSPMRVGFVLSGVVKISFHYNSREFIRFFCPENTFTGAYTALIEGRDKSDVDIIALEPTELLIFDYDKFTSRLPNHWSWQQIGRKLAERYLLMRERRAQELLTLTASQRFDSFNTQYPTLLSRIPQKDLATFLGITPQSLSRIRASRKKR